jgi:CHAD domain-containing protein
MTGTRTDRRWTQPAPPTRPSTVRTGPWFLAPAPVPATAIARRHLGEALDAHARIVTTEPDPEALHDFRVGLRKLRAHLRAHGRWTALDDGHIERLHELARATSRARDLQVQLCWLERIAEGGIGRTSDRARGAARALADDIRADAEAAEAAARASLGDDFLPVYDTFLAALEIVPDAGDATTFAAASEEAAVKQARRLRKRLRRIRRPRDQRAAHAARIAAKRLRYLLEPLADAHPRADRLVARLRSLQDLLGDMHDVHLLRERVRVRSANDPGMRGLARALRRKRKRLLRQVLDQASRRGTRRIVRRTRRVFAEVTRT